MTFRDVVLITHYLLLPRCDRFLFVDDWFFVDIELSTCGTKIKIAEILIVDLRIIAQ